MLPSTTVSYLSCKVTTVMITPNKQKQMQHTYVIQYDVLTIHCTFTGDVFFLFGLYYVTVMTRVNLKRIRRETIYA